MTQRPLGITVITILSAIGGLFALPVGCTATMVSTVPGQSGAFMIWSVVVMALGVGLLASCYGLWTFQSWGRKFTVVMYYASIVLGVVAIFPMLPGQKMTANNTVMQVVAIAVDFFVIAYLAKSEIKDLYEQYPPSQFDDLFPNREEPRL